LISTPWVEDKKVPYAVFSASDLARQWGDDWADFCEFTYWKLLEPPNA